MHGTKEECRGCNCGGGCDDCACCNPAGTRERTYLSLRQKSTAQTSATKSHAIVDDNVSGEKGWLSLKGGCGGAAGSRGDGGGRAGGCGDRGTGGRGGGGNSGVGTILGVAGGGGADIIVLLGKQAPSGGPKFDRHAQIRGRTHQTVNR